MRNLLFMALAAVALISCEVEDDMLDINDPSQPSSLTAKNATDANGGGDEELNLGFQQEYVKVVGQAIDFYISQIDKVGRSDINLYRQEIGVLVRLRDIVSNTKYEIDAVTLTNSFYIPAYNSMIILNKILGIKGWANKTGKSFDYNFDNLPSWVITELDTNNVGEFATSFFTHCEINDFSLVGHYDFGELTRAQSYQLEGSDEVTTYLQWDTDIRINNEWKTRIASVAIKSDNTVQSMSYYVEDYYTFQIINPTTEFNEEENRVYLSGMAYTDRLNDDQPRVYAQTTVTLVR